MKETVAKLEEIKNVVYELEGLLELARLRREKTEELLPLMKGRLEEINSLFLQIDGGEKNMNPENQISQNEVVTEEVKPAGEEIESMETADAEALASATEYEEKNDADSSPSDSLIHPDRKDAPKPAFCINDRFRFRRELFGGSDADFSSAMDLVATMDSYEEAEQYFTEELGWDPEDENVTDFLAIIERYFER